MIYNYILSIVIIYCHFRPATNYIFNLKLNVYVPKNMFNGNESGLLCFCVLSSVTCVFWRKMLKERVSVLLCEIWQEK